MNWSKKQIENIEETTIFGLAKSLLNYITPHLGVHLFNVSEEKIEHLKTHESETDVQERISFEDCLSYKDEKSGKISIETNTNANHYCECSENNSNIGHPNFHPQSIPARFNAPINPVDSDIELLNKTLIPSATLKRKIDGTPASSKGHTLKPGYRNKREAKRARIESASKHERLNLKSKDIKNLTNISQAKSQNRAKRITSGAKRDRVVKRPKRGKKTKVTLYVSNNTKGSVGFKAPYVLKEHSHLHLPHQNNGNMAHGKRTSHPPRAAQGTQAYPAYYGGYPLLGNPALMQNSCSMTHGPYEHVPTAGPCVRTHPIPPAYQHANHTQPGATPCHTQVPPSYYFGRVSYKPMCHEYPPALGCGRVYRLEMQEEAKKSGIINLLKVMFCCCCINTIDSVRK